MISLRRRSLLLITALSAGLTASTAFSEAQSGAYLAARQAASDGDYRAAADFFTTALVADPNNSGLMEASIMAEVQTGNFARALPIAKVLIDTKDGSNVANLVVLADLLHQGKFDAARAQVAAGKGGGPLVDGLVTAWADVGAGRMSDALAGFDKVANMPGLKAIGLYNKALAMASVGDFGGAEKIFSGVDGVKLHLSSRGIVAAAEVFSQLDRNPDALKLLDEAFGPNANPGIEPLRQRLRDGQAVPFDLIHNAQDGLSEVFLTVGAALKAQVAPSFTLIYARIAQYLSPGNTDATLLTAGLLELQHQYGLAIAAYESVPRGDMDYFAAQLSRAQALYASGSVDAGIAAIKQIVQANPGQIDAQVELGDLLRQQKRYAEALTAYDAAVALIATPKPGDWGVFYMRGICNERVGHWSQAEADLRQSLLLNPNQPEVLNYLGYAMVERGEKLSEALDLIRRAVAARPDDGYIVDSLSWAYFRLGDYGKALPIAERAARLTAVDPVITDHLGDVYWANGRKREAEFQWRRALSFNPAPTDATRIKRKLAVGLDAVLKEEGAPPLKAVSLDAPAGG